MNSNLRFRIRGLTYQFACLNPFRPTILAKGLPLGIELQAYKRDGVGRGLYRRAIHEPGLTNFLLSTFPPPANRDSALSSNLPSRNFLDIGANIGYFSCLLAKLAGASGKVLAFEPEPQNFALLEQNIRANNLANISARRSALGASEGSIKLGLYKPGNRGRHSIVDPNVKSTIDVPIARLDDLVAQSGLQDLTWALMKIDVEGYEPFVLQGAEKTLANTEMLVVEYSPNLWKRAGASPASVFDQLSRHFSQVSEINNDGLFETSFEEAAQSEKQTDLLFRRS